MDEEKGWKQRCAVEGDEEQGSLCEVTWFEENHEKFSL